MFISQLQLKNFKRFTAVTLDLSDAQTPPRLVLLIGANGSGKSSVFDAFEWLTKPSKDGSLSGEIAYYSKTSQSVDAIVWFSDGRKLYRHDHTFPDSVQGQDQSWVRNAFYGRSALRYVADLSRTAQSRQVELDRDSDRPRRYIEFDQRFESDIARLAKSIIEEIFNGHKFDSEQMQEKYLAPFNQAFERIFGSNAATSLLLRSMIPALDGKPAEIRFKKGTSEISYDLLSSGEKEVVNLLFNLFVRTQVYRDTIYFIDELDVHLNTSLQYSLLKEITENWLPAGCQLWTASHSLGFIQYAREAEHAVLLDFDQLDFDQPQTIRPQPKESLEVYEIAVPAEMLPSLFKDRQIFLCENQNDEYYNLLGLDRKLFVGVKDKRQVYISVKTSPVYHGLVDRDYLTDSEIARIRQQHPNLFVLDYYNFENYLYHPHNIAEVLPEIDVNKYKAEIIRQKNEQRDTILLNLKKSRDTDLVLTDNIQKDNNGAEEIASALKSDDFETCYPFFDMKGRFNRQILEQHNPTKEKLVKTKWFGSAINKVLQPEKQS